MNILNEIGLYGIIPVIKINDIDKALPLAKALCSGGLPVAEITFRTSYAKEAIKIITRAIPNMLVGAGTVLTCEQVDDAIESGAKFIVSPGLNRKVVKYCISKKILIIPGCSNPSDIEIALELGLNTVKFFPAEAAGGVSMLKAMSAPYGDVKFMPTGGIDEKNMLSYLNFDKVIACGGSFMVKDDLILNSEFDKIGILTRNAVSNMLGFKLAHIGINCNNEDEAKRSAMLISTMFNFQTKCDSKSIFCDSSIEFMNTSYLGKNGHIAIGTNFIKRAVNYFERMGLKFNADSKKYDSDGNFKAIYFADEICDFAIHLVQVN